MQMRISAAFSTSGGKWTQASAFTKFAVTAGVEVATLPPFRKMAVLSVELICRQALFLVEDIIGVAAQRIAGIESGAGAGAGAGAGRSRVAGEGREAIMAAVQDDCARVSTVVSRLVGSAVYDKLVFAFLARASLLFSLHSKRFERMMIRKEIGYMATVRMISEFQDVVVVVSTQALHLDAGVIAALRGQLVKEISALLQSLMVAQLTVIKDSLRRYLMTPSVLAAMTPEMSELRTVLRYMSSTVTTPTAATGASGLSCDVVAVCACFLWGLRGHLVSPRWHAWAHLFSVCQRCRACFLVMWGCSVVWLYVGIVCADSPASSSAAPTKVADPVWTWDPEHKSPHTAVSNGNILAVFQQGGSSGNAGVRGSFGFSSGVHTWDMTLKSCGGTSTQVRQAHMMLRTHDRVSFLPVGDTCVGPCAGGHLHRRCGAGRARVRPPVRQGRRVHHVRPRARHRDQGRARGSWHHEHRRRHHDDAGL